MCNCQRLYLSGALLPTDSPGPCGTLDGGFFLPPPIYACGSYAVITTLLALAQQNKYINLWLEELGHYPAGARATIRRKWHSKAIERHLNQLTWVAPNPARIAAVTARASRVACFGCSLKSCYCTSVIIYIISNLNSHEVKQKRRPTRPTPWAHHLWVWWGLVCPGSLITRI